MKKSAFIRFDILLVVLILLEWVGLFYSKQYLGQTANATLCFSVSVAIGLMLIAKFLNKRVDVVQATNTQKGKLLAILTCLPLLLFIPFVNSVFKEIPINPRSSDVIPIIETAVRRFLNGENPYYTIHMPTYDLPLNYLPLQWMPYTIPELLKIDYRWMAFAIWCIGCATLIYRSQHTAASLPLKLTIPLLLCLGLMMMLTNDRNLLGFTVEMMIAGYYMLFISGISQRNSLFQAVAIVLCLLSRYSLVLWLPLWAFVLCRSSNSNALFQTIGIIAVLVLAIYIIPFLSKDWSAFFEGYKYYDQAAVGEWASNVNADTGQPYHLYSGVGFANLFYEHLAHWEIADRIKRLQRVHLLVSILVPVAMGIWYYFKRHRIHARVFLLASFKIYLAFFLAFIQVPYMYLMLVGTFVSIALFAEQLRYQEAKS